MSSTDGLKDNCGKEGGEILPLHHDTVSCLSYSRTSLVCCRWRFTPPSHILCHAVMAFAVSLCDTFWVVRQEGASFLSLFGSAARHWHCRPGSGRDRADSYFVRPVSHSIRLAGTMMAGHAVIGFAGFAASCCNAPFLGFLRSRPGEKKNVKMALRCWFPSSRPIFCRDPHNALSERRIAPAPLTPEQVFLLNASPQFH